MNEKLSAKLKDLPVSPGVYFHKDAKGEIIYIGKAAVLRNRVRQYFQSKKDFDVKTLALVSEIVDTEWVETDSEIDALFLESEMVKRYMPRYNILLRDDKSQTFVRIDMKSDWPHVSFTRNPADDGATYVGPFYNGLAVKKALRYLRKVFPYYTKTPLDRKPDLDVHLGLSPRSDMTSDEYKKNLKKLIKYIKGGRATITNQIEKDMKKAARDEEFEKAAELRNRLRNLKELQRRIMFGDKEFLDISKDQALTNLADLLGLAQVPQRVEGFDISHMSGTNVVASMVVFVNGVSSRSQYRKFKMHQQRNDDVANMRETIERRFSAKNIKEWGLPDVILIDGGKGQLAAAISAVREAEIDVPVISIAKREEELILAKHGSLVSDNQIRHLQSSNVSGVAVLEESEYFIVNLHVGRRNASSHSRNLRGGDTISPYDELMKFFQRIRDESHRFAVSYHTTLKRSGAIKSKLEDVPGVGPATRKKLLKEFGSLRTISQASLDSLTRVVGKTRAENIKSFLNTDQKK